MASYIIHMAVAKEINKVLKRNEAKLLIGSIAPDISKCLNQSKIKSHFIDNKYDLPNIDKFLSIYKNKLNDDFVMGYYIHLYTDLLWFSHFLPEKINNNKMIQNLDDDWRLMCVYNDYTSLNIPIIKKFNLDLDLLYKENIYDIPKIIDGFPYNELDKLFDNAIKIIKSNNTEPILFDIDDINEFIDTCVNIITKTLS